MYTIYAEFQRFREVNLVELIGVTGVYVIWDARSKARPTYIGEGNILKRFTDHVKRDNPDLRTHGTDTLRSLREARAMCTNMNPRSLNA